MNVAFHRPCAPGQRECSPHRCLIALQLGREVMERGFASGLPPWQPRRPIAFPHHAIELFGQVHGSGNIEGKSAEGLCEALLRGRWIVDEAEQEHTGLPGTGAFVRRGVRSLGRAPSHSQADPKSAAQRDSGEISSLGPKLAPELAAIVATFGPPLL